MDVKGLLHLITDFYLISLAVGINVELQSYNYPAYYFRVAHRTHGGNVTIAQDARPDIFNMRIPGLCNQSDTVSFSTTASNKYLRHRNWQLFAESNDGSDLFANDACFRLHVDKWFPGHAAFESINFPGRYLRHTQFRLELHSYTSTLLFEMDASFRVLEPKCMKFKSYNIQTRYIGLTNSDAYISTIPKLWLLIRPGLSGHNGSVSFRSCYNATNYLRHVEYLLYNQNYEESRVYKLDATFTERDRFFSGTTAYESVNLPNYFVRHAGYRLRIDSYDVQNLFKQDASFYEVLVP